MLRPVDREGRIVTWLIFGGVALSICIITASAVLAWLARERTLADAGREANNLAFVLADHTERAIQAVDLAIEATLERGRAAGALSNAEDYAAWAGSRATHDSMHDRIGVLPQLDGVILLGADGVVVGSTRSWPPRPVNNADREYFRTLVGSGLDIYVARPIRSRATGEWVIPIAHRIRDADGAFLGVAAATIQSRYFVRLFGTLALGEGVSISLVSDRGIVMARYPHIEGLISRDISGENAFAVPARQPEGEHNRIVGIDGVERVTVGRTLSRFPLRVHVGLSVDNVLAPWYEIVRRLAFGVVALLLILAAGIMAAIRMIRGEARAAQERARLQGALSSQQDEFRQVVEGISQAVWRFGADGRMVLCNSERGGILGLPPAVEAKAPGLALDALQHLAKEAGADGAAELIRQLAPIIAAGNPTSFLHALPEGRTLAVIWRPMGDGGWLATFEDVTERHAAEARERFLARHDTLTGLPNRLGLQEHLASLLPRLAEGGGRAAVLYMDLDRFKEVNDTLGHPTGDALLKAVVDRIRRRIRAVRDGGDFVARLGGDEFAVVTGPAFNVTADAAADAATVAERLVQAIGEPFDLNGHRIVVGCSIGIALIPADGTTGDLLLRHADLALYRAKHQGRGHHCFFEPEMGAAAQTRRELEMELRRALEQPEPQEFMVQYQPLVAVGSRAITGFEALLRWQHPERGLISPAEFIPIAEEVGLIGALGELVLTRACREAKTWPGPVRIAVNVSALQFSRDRFVESVLNILDETGLEPGRLELEITEGALLRSTETTVTLLHQLRAAGVRIAMDDFGTGYSSLSYLLAFPFDKIKVDRSFVGQAVLDANATAIVRAVAGLCAQLGVTMTAEGVETEAQMRLLAAEGCNEVQGYLFGRPVDASEVPGVMGRLGHIERGIGRAPSLQHLLEKQR